MSRQPAVGGRLIDLFGLAVAFRNADAYVGNEEGSLRNWKTAVAAFLQTTWDAPVTALSTKTLLPNFSFRPCLWPISSLR